MHCGKLGKPGNDGEGDAEEESVEIEVVPGMKILAKFWKSRTTSV